MTCRAYQNGKAAAPHACALPPPTFEALWTEVQVRFFQAVVAQLRAERATAGAAAVEVVLQGRREVGVAV